MMPGPDWETRWYRWKEQHGPGSTTPSSLPPSQPLIPLSDGLSLKSSSPNPPPSYEESYQSDSYSESVDDRTISQSGDHQFHAQSTDDGQRHAPQIFTRHHPHDTWVPGYPSITPPLQTSTPLASRNLQYPRRPQSIDPSPLPSNPQPQIYLVHRPPSTPAYLYTPTPLRPSPPISFLDQNLDPLAISSSRRSRPHARLVQDAPAPRPLLPKVPKQISQSRALIEAELEREDQEREMRKEDERRAYHFYTLGLLGRCWDVWRRGREWVLVSCAVSLTSERKIDPKGLMRRTMLLVADDDLPDRQSPFSPSACVLSKSLATRPATPERV